MTRRAHEYLLGGPAFPNTREYSGAICGVPLARFTIMDAIRLLDCIRHQLPYVGPLPTCFDCKVRFDEAMERLQSKAVFGKKN